LIKQFSKERVKDTMNRRDLLKRSAAVGLASALPVLGAGRLSAISGTGDMQTDKNQPLATPNPLTPSAKGPMPVAFVISDGAQVIDFAGPWEVFADAPAPGSGENAFQVYTVAETLKQITATGGMKIAPDYTFQTAPAPKVIVIPAQSGVTEAMLQWIRISSKTTDVTMSVCTGAFVLARTGLLSGKPATTFHEAFDRFAATYPDIKLKRGARFVEDGNLASSGGLSSGIDLAFRVVERYFGRDAAEKLAYDLEYQGKGWMNADSNEVYAKYESGKKPAQQLCPVCGMDADPAISSSYKGRTYYFCSQSHKVEFEDAPQDFVKTS
jgi:putative intracellular protease/amidase/YHS domain-containing protein